MAVIGEKEAEAGTVAVRRRGGGKKQIMVSRESFERLLMKEVKARALGPTVGDPQEELV